MNHPQENSTANAEDCARYFKALADPIRLQMIRVLQAGPQSVSDFALLLDLEMPNVSHHLRVLYHAGLVSTERDGKFIYYSLRPEVLDRGTRDPAGSLDFGCCKLDLRTT